MTLRTKALGAVVAGVLLLGSVPDSHAALTDIQRKCQETIAKVAGKFMKAHLKELTKCADKNLKDTGSCDFAKRGEKLDKAESKLRSGLSKKCGAAAFGSPLNVSPTLKTIGFPGKCPDDDPSDGFTETNLNDCIFETHRDIAVQLFDLQYGSNGEDAVIDFETRNPLLGKDLGKCQKDVGKNGLKLIQTVQKEISKCRNNIEKGKILGVLPVNCANNLVETKPAEKIAKAVSKARAKIIDKCPTPLTTSGELDLCDIGGGPQTDPTDAADCITDTHVQASDDPDNTGLADPFPTDIIDIEYHLAAVCGDNIVNDPLQAVIGSLKLGAPPEECDGLSDDDCPGLCGDPTSNFPCLCTDIPRERVIEHSNSDLDNGWTGTSHDSTVVEGGGYVVDLYDCDGPGGPDVLCTIGPSCALAPNAACASDATCLGVGNFCRKRFTAVGPHCNENVQQFCTGDGNCNNSSEDFCRKTPHGIPLPLSSGGTAVCVVNVFSEDVTGTVNLSTGAGAVRLRQDSITHLASGTVNQPCPTCGFFCTGTSGGAGPGTRVLCQADSDCPASATCVTDPVCSFGPNQDKLCRRDPPFGNATLLFGTPSVDCPPSPGADISSGGLDILFNPSTTGSLTTLPSIQCNAPGFAGNKCITGTEVGKACVADSDCAGGGAGSCAEQCFCPGLGGNFQQPNLCFSACHGGANDYAPCSAASDCPGGVCESSSCRLSAGVCTGGAGVGSACAADTDCGVGGTCGDGDSSGEGFCPGGPVEGLCSFTTLKGCLSDSECRPSGSCSFCKSDNSEICTFKNKDCFPSAGYSRTGAPGVPDKVSVSHFCIPASASGAVNGTAGIPGPAALELPATTEDTGF